jgi:hypothetical protein
MARPKTCMSLRYLTMKTKLLESKIITSLRASIHRCACETQTSQQNGRSCFLKCRTLLSQQESTLLKIKRMTFVSCQQTGTMPQPKSWRRYHLIAGRVEPLQKNEAVRKVEYLSKSPFKNVLYKKIKKKIKKKKTHTQPANEEMGCRWNSGWKGRNAIKANSENDASLVESSDDDWIQYLHV